MNDDPTKPSEIERQLKLQQKLRFEIEGQHDGRPRDQGDMLEALKREHPEMWKEIESKK